MKKAVSAGGIVTKKAGKEIKILLVRHENGKLVFPKGHVKPGEKIEEAALREVSEETGLHDLEIIKKLGVVNRLADDYGEIVNKDIYLFLMASADFIHHSSDEEYGWYSLNEAHKLMEYPEESRFLLNHEAKIRNE